jgi:hypothetical protein
MKIVRYDDDRVGLLRDGNVGPGRRTRPLA